MKLLDFMKRRRNEEKSESQKEIMAKEGQGKDKAESEKKETKSTELFNDDNDIGFC